VVIGVSGRGLSYLVSVLIVTAVAVAAAIVVVGVLYPSIVGLAVRREWSFTVTVYDNGHVRVVLENRGWGVSITGVEVSMSVGGGAASTVDLSWSPPLPLDPGRQAIGVGAAAAAPPGTTYEGTITVTFSDGSRDSKPFKGAVVARG